ncbi:hypothetical protein [Methanolobus profundi]|uniref:Repeat domain-containing protein n=1 Tax=Methanolobus profundi TaxID=487685 RepID=A0A1I4R2E4_9EURY|nr:hypothetical protein [Methanolobus profundi]SFM46116.1 hypothetical protein SAMN04488696_1312 [Methanolobus profundi]
MMASNRKERYILLVILAAIAIFAIVLNEGPRQVEEEIIIPDEILDCDYCTFDYGTPYTLAYTYLQPDGNRVIDGKLDILNAERLEVNLEGIPEWVLAAPSDNGSIWAVVMDNGAVQAFELSDGTVEEVDIDPSNIHPDTPPILMVKDDEAFLLAPGSWNESLYTHPIVLASSGRNVFIDTEGDLVFRVNEKESARLDVNALPDARLIQDENERILLLTGPTEEYRHGVLGDSIEASSITIVETAGVPGISKVIDLPEGDVVEGIAPIWSDLNDDGKREIIVTLSNAEEGARVVVLDEDGSILAEGPDAGTGYRWRHQIAVAAFGPDGETELVDVLTPHIGGIVEFYQWEDDELKVVSGLSGYSSHLAGSRDLDMAIAGNFDEDEEIELLVPLQSYRELAVLEHTDDGVTVVTNIELTDSLSTNIAAVNNGYGMTAIGVGTNDGMLSIWF